MLLHFALLCFAVFAVFFINWMFMATLHQAGLLAPLSKSICSLCHILVIHTIFQTLHQQKDLGSPKANIF